MCTGGPHLSTVAAGSWHENVDAALAEVSRPGQLAVAEVGAMSLCHLRLAKGATISDGSFVALLCHHLSP